MPLRRACPGLGDPPGLGVHDGGASRGAGGRRAGGLGCGEQVVGAGEQLAGDCDGGDLRPAAFDDRGVGGGELRGPLGGLGGLVQDPPQPRRPLFGDVPVPDTQVRAADGRGQPGEFREVMTRNPRPTPSSPAEEEDTGTAIDTGRIMHLLEGRYDDHHVFTYADKAQGSVAAARPCWSRLFRSVLSARLRSHALPFNTKNAISGVSARKIAVRYTKR